LPFIVTAWALTIASAFAFAGGLDTPSLGDVVASGAYIVLVPTMIFLLALGTAALVGSRSAAITGLLAWQFLVSPLLLGAGFLGVFREGFLIAATERLRPSTIGEPTELPMSIGAAVITLVLLGRPAARPRRLAHRDPRRLIPARPGRRPPLRGRRPTRL
jgi:hypothetical protein